MAFCKEKLVNYLEGLGYNLVRLPRTGINPLDIILKDDKQYSNLGSLSKVWTSEEDVPKPLEDGTAGNIDQKQTSLIDSSVGVKVLGDIFSGMGFSVPELNIAFAKSKKIIIKFNNVVVTSIAPFEIGKYLKSGDLAQLDISNIFVKQFLDEDLPIYIISETLRSNSITIEAYKDSSTSASLDFNILQGAVKADPKIKVEKATESSITYTGDKLLVFGFKCYEIAYEESGWGIKGMGNKVFLKLEQSLPPVKLEANKRIVIE